MIKKTNNILCLIFISNLLIISTFNQTITITSPKQLKSKLSESSSKNQIKVHLSPLGLKPLSGVLSIIIKSADPLNGCTTIQSVSSDFPIFLMANDQQCLESVKAKNVAKSGAHGLIVLKNDNITLHDKQVDLVHIPIVQLQKQFFQIIQDYSLNTPSSQLKQINALISFKNQNSINPNVIQMDVYISPTQIISYQFLHQIHEFLIGQPMVFTPHYVFNSQRENQGEKNYKGCYSSGRYCPPELKFEGKMQGQSVVSESLRQIIIWKQYGGMDGKYWNYINGWIVRCLGLKKDVVFLNSQQTKICSQQIMYDFDINQTQIQKRVQESFQNNGQPRVDDNIYLLEQRQAYIREKINKHPVVLINKKEYPLDAAIVKQRICELQLHEQDEDGSTMSQNCQKHLNKSTGLSVPEILIGTVIMGGIMAIVMFGYKWYIQRKMKKQMKGDVSKTLEQYYKYMQAYETQNPSNALRQQLYPNNQPGASQHGYRKDTNFNKKDQSQSMSNNNENASQEVQMTELARKKKQQEIIVTKNISGSSKSDKHQTLNEEKNDDSSSYSGSDEQDGGRKL